MLKLFQLLTTTLTVGSIPVGLCPQAWNKSNELFGIFCRGLKSCDCHVTYCQVFVATLGIESTGFLLKVTIKFNVQTRVPFRGGKKLIENENLKLPIT